MTADETALTPMQTVEAVVMAYTHAQRDVAEAFRLLRQAQARLSTFLEYPHVFPEGWSVSIYEETPAQAAERIRRDAWWHIYQKTGIDKLCSIKQAQEFHDQISRGDMPELTIENIERLLENLRAGLPDMLEEAIQEVFDWLRPSDRGWGPKYATNTQYLVGPKVILDYVIELGWRGETFSVRYHYGQHLRALDNVFHLLDGAGIAQYPSDLVTAINDAGRRGRQECETRYFQCRWYKKGTLHIEFKRTDLVDELNRRGGGDGLPGPDRRRSGQATTV